MLGVLLDVSGSMEQAFSVHYYDRRRLEHNVRRSHAIITTLNSIVNQEVIAYQRNESVFACCFGLEDYMCGGADTCDLITLLENVIKIRTFQEVKQRLDELRSEQQRWNKKA